MIPAVGRIVHWYSDVSSPPEAGIVVDVQSETSVTITHCGSMGTWATAIACPYGSDNAAEDGSFWLWPPAP